MGGTRDNKEWELNWEQPFPRILGYKRKSDIKEVDIMEIQSVHIAFLNGLQFHMTFIIFTNKTNP